MFRISKRDSSNSSSGSISSNSSFSIGNGTEDSYQRTLLIAVQRRQRIIQSIEQRKQRRIDPIPIRSDPIVDRFNQIAYTKLYLLPAPATTAVVDQSTAMITAAAAKEQQRIRRYGLMTMIDRPTDRFFIPDPRRSHFSPS